jgi:hypothetical protein
MASRPPSPVGLPPPAPLPGPAEPEPLIHWPSVLAAVVVSIVCLTGLITWLITHPLPSPDASPAESKPSVVHPSGDGSAPADRNDTRPARKKTGVHDAVRKGRPDTRRSAEKDTPSP